MELAGKHMVTKITIVVEHKKPIESLGDIAAQRIYSLQGVEHAEAVFEQVIAQAATLK